jgi:Fe-S oxidoreductase
MRNVSITPVGDLLVLMSKFLDKTNNPLGLTKECYEWEDEHIFPRRGPSILYTSCFYQMMPYMKAFAKALKLLEGIEGIPVSIKFILYLSSKINLHDFIPSFFLTKEELGRLKNTVPKILKNIAMIIKQYDPQVAYLYEDEPYSGAILYDLGFEEAFKEYARKVANYFKSLGIKRIYTIDPHTYHALKYLYPKYVDNFDFEVLHYLEILSEKPDLIKTRDSEREYVIHDSCILARYANMSETIRKALDTMKVRYKEPIKAGRRTRCCGGPIESISPSATNILSESRMKMLTEVSRNVLVMCPICYINLMSHENKFGARVFDIAELL